MYNYKIHAQELLDDVLKCKSENMTWQSIALVLNAKHDEQTPPTAWKKRYLRAYKSSYVYNDPDAHNLDDIKAAIIKLLPYGIDYDALPTKFNINRYETDGIIQSIINDGLYGVRREQKGNKTILSLEKGIAPSKTIYEHAIGKTKTLKALVLSDTHYGSINEQPSFVNWLYDEAQRRGITIAYHCGDLSEGFKRSRPEHIFSLHAISFDDQVAHIVKNYPKRDGITTYFITGNHDHFHIQNGGANIGKAISMARPDMVYLGMNNAVIDFGGAKINLFHAGDGSAYATSYAGQKYLDSLSGGDKPSVLFAGHHHKSLYMTYRNVHYFEVPSCHLQSDWERGKRIQNTSGAWFVEIMVDDAGSVVSLKQESVIQYKKIQDDWKAYK